VVRAAEAGKHLLIEKPVATSFEELRVMCEAVRKAKVCTVVGFVLRWNPAVINIRTCLTEGLLGTPFYVGADYRHNLRQSGFDVVRGDVGAMLEGGCHAMDMARYLMGSDIVCVSALGWRSAPEPEQAGRSEPEQAGEASDIVSILQFENGAVGKVSAFTSQWMPYQFNIEVLGTEGAMRGNRLYTKRLPGLVDFAELPTVLPDSGDVAHHPFGPEIDHFVDCILAGSESGVSLEDVVNPHEACFAAEMSRANNGAAIRLPLAG
jgi:predicted dehydrogenase